MPAPNKSLATLRPDLGTFMEFDLEASRMGFVGLQVMPVLDVQMQANVFGKIKLKSLLQGGDTKRAPGSGYNRRNYEFEDDSYACRENGIEEPVDDREAEMYAEYFDAELLAATRARDLVLRNYEKRVAGKTFDSGTHTTTAAAVAWATLATAAPVDDVEASVRRLRALGVKANALIVSWQTFRNLRLCEQIKDAIQSAGAGRSIEPSKITAAMLAEIFDLPHVLVGDSQENTANEGQAASLGEIWSNELAAVCRVAETRDIRETCFGRTFHWSADGSSIGGTVESYRDETIRGDVVRCRMDTDEKLMYGDAIDLIDLTP